MSRIEQIIAEIEDYIDGCKFQTFSNANILVNKEEMEEYLVELKMRVPDEIKKYQKIINQQDAILQDARSQAQGMISDAQTQIDELVSDHEVMQIAYQKANEIVEEARAQAQSIIDDAVNEANGIRRGAIEYTDSILAAVQNIAGNALNEERERFAAFEADMKNVFDVCSDNRKQLSGSLDTINGGETAEAAEENPGSGMN